MVKNLAKAPLVGLLYASLFWYAAEFLPWSDSYSAVLADFTMPMSGLLLILAYAVFMAVTYAVVFSNVRKGGIKFILMTVVACCGFQWAIPLFRQMMFGEITGVMTLRDTLMQLLGCAGVTIIAFLLALLLYRIPEQQTAAPEPKYKPGILGMIIRLLVLPVIFCIAYYLLWYFLFWQVDAAREYYSVTEKLNFMGEIINTLINYGSEVGIVLLTGLLYALFSLLLVTQLLGKRIPCIIINTLFCLSGALLYLIPNPVMPYEVRMAHLPETGALMLLYGVLSAVLLQTAFKRQGQEQATGDAAPAKKGAGQKQPVQAKAAKAGAK